MTRRSHGGIPQRVSTNSSIPHLLRVRYGPLNRRERIGPVIQHVARRQSNGAPAQASCMKVTFAIGLELGGPVPRSTINFQGNAVVDEQILVAESRHAGLGHDVVARSLKTKSSDGLKTGPTVGNDPGDPVMKSSRRSIANLHHLRRRKEMQTDRRLECSDRVFLIEATDGLP